MRAAYLDTASGRISTLVGEKAFQVLVLLHDPTRRLYKFSVQPVRTIRYFLAGFLLSTVSAVSCADTVPPTYNPAAPPMVEYYGYTGTNFDTPAAACTDAIAHSWEFTSQTGGIYDHTEPYTDNVMKCFATFYVNSNPVTSWWSNVLIMRSCDGRGWNNYPMTCMRNVCPANSTGTPTDNPTICTCDTGYVADPTRTRCVPNNLTIKLDYEGVAPIEPTALLPFHATVTDQNGVAQAGKSVTVSVNVNDGTGGHIHTDGRPKGILSCASSMGGELASCTLSTDYSGQVLFDFISTPISGTHVITATCSGCSNTETKSVDVKVSNLIPIPASTKYALADSNGNVIGVTWKHKKNHFLTSPSVLKLNKLADVYDDVNPDAVLYLNDASLEWGGLFDVGSRSWSAPHSTHHKGRSLDVRAANSGPNNEGAVPAARFKEFLREAKDKKFSLGLHCKDSSDTSYCLGQPNNRHFHVDF